jgi:hypothetical protein
MTRNRNTEHNKWRCTLSSASTSRVILVLAVLSLAGCSPYDAIRNGPPNDQLQVAAAADPLSECVLAESTDHLGFAGDYYTYSKVKSGETYRIVAYAGSMAGSVPTWNITFVPTGTKQTRVEVRASRSLWGSSNYPDEVWGIVRTCGARS